jgi:serine O-acetyltransferase
MEFKNKNEYKKVLKRELSARCRRFLDIPVVGGLLIKMYELVMGDYHTQFMRSLRRTEYFKHQKGLLNKILYSYSRRRLKSISVLTGLSIPTDVFEEGLSIAHMGSIVVNSATRVGRNCRIHNNVNIGASNGSPKAPQIGNNVYIEPGAVIYGDIRITDNVYIGANAVVNKDILEPYSVVAGVPAKVISRAEEVWWIRNHDTAYRVM